MSNNQNVFPSRISFSTENFLKVLESLVTKFGSAGESMIFQMGRDAGIHFTSSVLTEIKEEMELLALFEDVISRSSLDGWANMSVKEFNPQRGSIEIILKDNAFEPMCLHLDLPQCFFLRGYISGMIKELTNMDYKFFSSQCIANGDQDCSVRLVADLG
jgi:predicted hydrocarbon binding protein